MTWRLRVKLSSRVIPELSKQSLRELFTRARAWPVGVSAGLCFVNGTNSVILIVIMLRKFLIEDYTYLIKIILLYTNKERELFFHFFDIYI